VEKKKTMKIKRSTASKLTYMLAMAAALQLSCQSQPAESHAAADETAGIYENIEFDMPRVAEPSFNNYSVNIVDFGAVGDGLTKNTEAIAKAIDDVAAHGGGRVVIPRGMWLTGPIILKSNINIHTEHGAFVVFSDDFDDYPLIATSFEGLETYRCLSPVYGKDLENIAFTGKGVFDGSGDAWRMVKKGKMTASQWKKLVNSGGVLSDDGKKWYPSESSKRGDAPGNFNVPNQETKEEFEQIKDYLRPVMVSLVNCKKVLLDGPTFQNSPAWNIHPLMSEDITIRNLTIRNPWYSQNGDGLDLESCKNVVIYNNSFDVGDDAICFKSGKDEDGRRRAMPTENVIVKNNVVYHGHGGFVIGSEMSGGVRNVHVSNCTFMGTDVGLRFKSTRGRGGIVENIWISNIDMIGIPAEAIRFNMFYGGNSPVLEEDQDAETEARDETKVAVNEETPIFRNIFMKNITATGSGQAAMFQGLPEMSLKNVKLENAVLEAKKGITMVDAEEILFSNVKVLAEKSPALTLYNSRNVDVSGLAFQDSREPAVKVLGPLTENIHFKSSDFKEASRQIMKGNDAGAKAFSMKD
jgi:polygalacturonase